LAGDCCFLPSSGEIEEEFLSVITLNVNKTDYRSLFFESAFCIDFDDTFWDESAKSNFEKYLNEVGPTCGGLSDGGGLINIVEENIVFGEWFYNPNTNPFTRFSGVEVPIKKIPKWLLFSLNNKHSMQFRCCAWTVLMKLANDFSVAEGENEYIDGKYGLKYAYFDEESGEHEFNVEYTPGVGKLYELFHHG